MASSASSAITTSIASETTSLLQQQQCQQRTSFTAAGDDHARRGRDKKEGGRSTGNSSCMYYVFLFTACAAVVVGSAVLLLSFMGTTTTTSSSTSSVSILANNIPATKELLPLPLPPLIPATTDTLTNNNITFGGLAQRMVPPAVAAMWDAVRATLTETVRPQDVYQTRQRLLTARNLLDVFSPVYPNATTRRTTTTTMDATDDATTANAKHASATTTVDAWSLLRAYLDTGYSLVGEFLDLYHANVTYTERQMEAVRQTVLDWKNHQHQQTGFFSSSSSSCNNSSSTADAAAAASHHHHHRRHDAGNNCFNVSLFLMTTMTTPLGSSSSSGGFTHDKASRLFWKHYGDGDTGEKQQQQQQQRFFVALPQSDDDATTSLRTLGCKQLALALHYYRRMYQHETILETTAGHADHTDGSSNNNSNKTDDDSNNAAHEDYHDLRKVLRSLVNEYNLFRKNILGATKSNVMFPDGLKTKAAIGVLNTARGLLGDLNDDWTAYMFYKAHDNDHNKHHQKRSTRRIHNHGSQKKLAEEIERRWKEFKRWSIEVDLQGTLQSLLAGMSSSSSTQQ